MKKIAVIISVLLLGFLSWYLLIKPYDYLVTFKVKANTGTINQSLKLWNGSLEGNSPIQQERLAKLIQQINTGDSVYTYEWDIKSLNDSMSRVEVYVKDINHSFQNKMSIPFGKTAFEKQTEKTVTNFLTELKDHLKNIRIKIVGKSETQSTYCACTFVKTEQVKKARGMMRNYTFLSDFVFKNNIEPNGTPFIEITNWDMQKDTIEYNFCFPIVKSDSLTQNKRITYKKYNGVKAIKAVYNGNYITSDRAWYALLDYAERENIRVHKTPLEIFYNNPNYGGNALNWEAHIFLPIKN